VNGSTRLRLIPILRLHLLWRPQMPFPSALASTASRPRLDYNLAKSRHPKSPYIHRPQD